MNADSIKDLCFGIVGAQAAAAQAAHDARQPEVDRLKNEVARLRRRLENDRVWRERDGELVEEPADLPESQDGIACRDETIKLQDEKIDELKKLNAELLAALRAVAVALDCNTSQGGDLEKRLYKANPETPQAVRAAIASAERAGR